MLQIDNEKLQKFEMMKNRFLEKTVIPKENNWKMKSNNEIWLEIVSQVMVVGNSTPHTKFMQRIDLQNDISYDSLLKLASEEEVSKRINSVLLAVGTRYASKELSKSTKTRCLVHNFNEFKGYINGNLGFLNKLTKISNDKLRIDYIMKNLRYLKNKGARDFLMEQGIVKNAIAFDIRVQNILQEMDIQLPKGFAGNPKIYATIEKELLEKVCEPLGISGVMFDRMLYQNYEGCLAIARM